MSAVKLIDFLFDNIETSPAWNKHVRESKKIYVSFFRLNYFYMYKKCIETAMKIYIFFLIQVIDENTDLVYQATKALGNGAIGARDFVILRHRGQHESYFISSGISVNFSAVPNRKNFVR